MVAPLPSSWAAATLGDALELKYGKGLPSYERRRGTVAVFGSNGVIGVTSLPLTTGATIIVGRKGSFGEVSFSAEPCWPIDTTYYVDEFVGQSPEFWSQYLRYLPLKDFDRSSAVPGLRRSDALALPVHIPPAPEQERIARRIEGLFQGAQNASNRLRQAAALTSSFRFTLLEAAASGAMTRVWRHDRESESTSTPSEPSGESPDVEPATLPRSWRWTRVGDVGEVRLGRQRSPRHHTGDHMRPYLRVANVFEDRIDTSDVMEMNFSDREFETYCLKDGDVLLNEGQSIELVGRPAMFRGDIGGACFTNTLVRFRARSEVNPEFALLVFRYYLHSGRFRKIAKITTNLAHLGAGRFASMKIPLPPIDEQAEIVDRCHGYLAGLTRLEALGTDLLRKLEQLERLILDRAFAGALVPQDSQDESAHLLLRRISEMRASQRHNPRPVLVRSHKMRQIVQVKEALAAAGRSLSAQELFWEAGFPKDASPDLVERFFLDVREQLRAGAVSRHRAGDEDIFTLGVSQP